jgi:hypothetical protein
MATMMAGLMYGYTAGANRSKDMSRSDLIHALRYLTFVDGFGLVRLDHEVRDYLLRVLQER